jgi:integrase
MTVTPNAVLIRPEHIQARSQAEAHAMAFLARYRVSQTRASYGLSLRHTFVTMALDAGQAERDIAISTGHSDTRMVAYYDRGRDNISRNSTHAVAAWIEGAM